MQRLVSSRLFKIVSDSIIAYLEGFHVKLFSPRNIGTVESQYRIYHVIDVYFKRKHVLTTILY